MLVGPLTEAETVLAVTRLVAMRPHVAAVAPLVDADDLWRLCRDELTGVDVGMEGWDIRGRWFGVVVAATPQLGELPRGETIPWRIVARTSPGTIAVSPVSRDHQRPPSSSAA